MENPVNECIAQGDPHYTTFDGKYVTWIFIIIVIVLLLILFSFLAFFVYSKYR